MDMDYKSRITIDLSEYGQEGTVEIGAPTFRRKIELSNEISRQMTIEQSRTGVKVDNLSGGRWSIMQRMAYVTRAPFRTTYEGFLEYTDMMDAQDPGSADRLWDAICEAVKRIDEGGASPLEPSQGAGTPSTD